jgi:hypothetical protein
VKKERNIRVFDDSGVFDLKVGKDGTVLSMKRVKEAI